MIHYFICAAIAYFFANYINSRSAKWFTAAWSGVIATIAGFSLGSLIVFGAMDLLGATVNQNAILKAIGQAFLWSLVGASAGIYQGRQKAILGAHGSISSIPTKAWLGWGAVVLFLTISVIALMGAISSNYKQNPRQQALQSKQKLENSPSTQSNETWGENDKIVNSNATEFGENDKVVQLIEPNAGVSVNVKGLLANGNLDVEVVNNTSNWEVTNIGITLTNSRQQLAVLNGHSTTPAYAESYSSEISLSPQKVQSFYIPVKWDFQTEYLVTTNVYGIEK